MAEERLILAVSDNPVMYDLTLKGYHDQNLKMRAWRDISADLGVSVDDCKKKWKYLRDKYLKERKREIDRKKSGAGATSHKRWKYMAILGFLEPHCKERATSTNFAVVQGGEEGEVSGDIMALLGPMMSPQRVVVESEMEASEDLFADTSPHSPPRTSTTVQETPIRPAATRGKKSTQPLTLYQESVLSSLEKKPDEDEHFLMSLVPSLRRLNHQKKAQVRMRFQQALYDVEFGEM